LIIKALFLNMQAEIHKRIKLLRKDARLSQQDVADKLKISAAAYSKIERGLTKLNEFYIYKLPEILGCKIEDILTSEELKNYQTFELPLKSVAEESQVDYNRAIVNENQILSKQIELLEKAIKDKEDIIQLLKKELKRLEDVEKGKS